MPERDHTHVGKQDVVYEVEQPFTLPEPSDPARYRKVLYGLVAAGVTYAVTELGLDLSSELEKAIVAVVALVVVERVPNDA